MSKSVKNLIVVLAIIITAFAGYYMFSQEAGLVLQTTESDLQLEQLLSSAEEFTERQRILSSIRLNTELFDNSTFTALQDFSPEPQEFEIRRPDPFLSPRLDQSRSTTQSE